MACKCWHALPAILFGFACKHTQQRYAPLLGKAVQSCYRICVGDADHIAVDFHSAFSAINNSLSSAYEVEGGCIRPGTVASERREEVFENMCIDD